jgi:broad specificity phosphatase PhoE
MRRTIETAVVLREALGVPVSLLPALCEMNGVHTERGMTRTAILEEWPGLCLDEGITDVGWWTPYDDFEPMEKVYGRAATAIGQIRERHAHGETLAIVTHGGFGTALIATILGLTPPSDDVFLFNNCGISRVDFRREHDPEDPARGVRLYYHNLTAHLTPEMVT